MSLKNLFDTDEERAYWFSALARFCDAVSVSVIITGNEYFALITIAIGTIGREVAGFYKLQIPSPKDQEPK
jgi:hypothetical protein